MVAGRSPQPIPPHCPTVEFNRVGTMTKTDTGNWHLLVRTMDSVNARAHELVRLSSELVAQTQALNEDLRNLATVTASLTVVAPIVKDGLDEGDGDNDD